MEVKVKVDLWNILEKYDYYPEWVREKKVAVYKGKDGVFSSSKFSFFLETKGYDEKEKSLPPNKARKTLELELDRTASINEIKKMAQELEEKLLCKVVIYTKE